MERTVLFGGSFDPIHTGHAMVANYVSQTGFADSLWLMPGRLNPLKAKGPSASDAQRLEMCRLVADRCRNVEVCDAELSLPAPSYTCRTLEHLAIAEPHRKFILLVGSDNWLCFDSWKNHEEILRNHELLIYPRPGYPVRKETLPPGVTLLEEAPQALISSTFIRKGFSEHRNMSFFVTEKVLEYIESNKLYS